MKTKGCRITLFFLTPVPSVSRSCWDAPHRFQAKVDYRHARPPASKARTTCKIKYIIRKVCISEELIYKTRVESADIYIHRFKIMRLALSPDVRSTPRTCDNTTQLQKLETLTHLVSFSCMNERGISNVLHLEVVTFVLQRE